MARNFNGAPVATALPRARLLPLEPYMTNQEFWANVAIGEPDACWPWLGSTTNGGYGNYHGKGIAHCVAHEARFGPIAPGLERAHQCHNPGCCNPSHIKAATHQENQVEMGIRRRGKPNRILTEAIVRAAKLMRAAGRKIREIASEFGVRADTLGKALNGTNWAWVTV